MDTEELTPFWMALAENARPLISSSWGRNSRSLQDLAISELPSHGKLACELPATLIHNDFNPRNIALRPAKEGCRLCAYDWEMARIGLPQHDLAEMLCFVLSPEGEITLAKFRVTICFLCFSTGRRKPCRTRPFAGALVAGSA